MSVMDAKDLGRALARRHADRGEFALVTSLLNYGEQPRRGDWTLRSALTRLAQPHPARVGAALTVMRRLDGPIHHVHRLLEQHTVTCDRALSPDVTAEPLSPYPDVRTADLARLVAAGVDPDQLLVGYGTIAELTTEERVVVPLLAVAVTFDQLAVELTDWADQGPANPPVESVDRIVAAAGERLDELGVPVDTGPPPGAGRRGGRG